MSKMLIVSWNLEYTIEPLKYSKRLQEIYTNLIKMDADILCLQECTDDMIQKLGEIYTLLGTSLSHCGTIAVFYKPNLVQNVNMEVEQMDGCLICRFTDFILINVHLAPYPYNNKKRENQLHKVLEHTENTRKIIIGDTNMQSNETIESFNDVALDNSVYDTTWNESYFNDAKNNKERFDRVYSNFKINNFKVYQEFSHLSDHQPIRVNI
jgi:endonuclease/exonuclease/phosphatase family metal-dependent hydrolase